MYPNMPHQPMNQGFQPPVYPLTQGVPPAFYPPPSQPAGVPPAVQHPQVPTPDMAAYAHMYAAYAQYPYPYAYPGVAPVPGMPAVQADPALAPTIPAAGTKQVGDATTAAAASTDHG